MRYRWFHRRWVCRTLGWLSHVWICVHTCPVIRHCNQESKVKKTCADYDLAILRSYRYIPSYTKYNLVYTIFLWCWVCRTVGWLSNVWICVHTCPVIRHLNLESKVKKTCADYDLAILRSYRYIPSYTKYNLVYTIFLWCWVCRTVGWLSNVWICVHTCPVIRHLNLESKVKNKVCWLWLGYTSIRPVYTKLYYVQLGIYWEIPPFTWNQAQAVLRARFVSAARLCRASLATFFLSPVCSTDRPPRRGLPRPNCHSHGLTS